MRTRVLSALALALLLGTAADAGTLTSATWTQRIDPYPPLAGAFPLTRTTAQLGAAGSSTGSSVSVSLSFPQFTTVYLVPKTPQAGFSVQIKITQGGPQAITATPGMATATQGIPGTVIVMTAGHVRRGVNASMIFIGVNSVLGQGVPLSQGGVGRASWQFTITGQTHYVTVDFFAWTPGTVTFTGLTSKGRSLPDVVAMGSFALSAAGGGTVTLVSPTKVSVDGSLEQQRRVFSLTTLKLTFVPEPGTLLLLGAAAAALVLARRR
jgi:hypothetical protein